MIYRLNRSTGRLTNVVVAMLGGYRSLYFLNWVVKYSMPGAYFTRVHGVSAMGGVLNILFYCDFLLQMSPLKCSILKSLVESIDSGANEIVTHIETQMKVLGSDRRNQSDHTDLEDCKDGVAREKLLPSKHGSVTAVLGST